MTCWSIAINVEKVISAWLDVMLPVLIPLCTRRPLQVLWTRRARSPGEVKHRLLPQSGLPWTTGMTGRNEITACDSWLNQRLPTSANVLLIYPSETLSAIFIYLFSVSKLIFFFQVPGRQPFDTEISLLLWFDKTPQNKVWPRKYKYCCYILMPLDRRIYRQCFYCSSDIYFIIFWKLAVILAGVRKV